MAVGHTLQVEPSAPHAAKSVPGAQVLPLQHPPHIDIESHTQVGPLHRVPGEQAGLVSPQPQVPLARQVLAVRLLQFRQAPPSRPHWPVVGGFTHVVLLAQQPAHVAASHWHTPPTQRSPGPHGALPPQRHCPPLQTFALSGSQPAHTAPLLPHCDVVWLPAPTHMDPLQQPPEHVVALQPWQAWPTH